MSKQSLPIGLATICIGVGVAVSPALADGGTLRFTGQRGDWSISIFTSPTPLSAGPVDLSVLVLKARNGRPITHLPIEVRVGLAGSGDYIMRVPATSEAASNKLMSAARLELSQPGTWHIDVSIQVADRSEPMGFDVYVEEQAPPWLQMGVWIAWPLVPIGLFVIHQILTRRSRSGGVQESSLNSNTRTGVGDFIAASEKK